MTTADAIPPAGKVSPRRFRALGRIAKSRSSQIVVAFTVFLLILLWGAVATQLNLDRVAVLGAARTNNDNLARAYSEHVFGTVKLLDQVLLRVKDAYERDRLGPDLSQGLRESSNTDAGALLVQILDEQGYVLASTASTASTTSAASQTQQSFADREYFRVHTKPDADELYISAPLQGRITGKHTIVALSRRLRKANGDFAGVVYVSFNPEYLSGFFSGLVISEKSTFAIVGRDMIIRDAIKGANRAADMIGKSMANSQFPQALARAPNGDYQTASLLDGVARLLSYRSLPNLPLIVVVGLAEDDIFADYRERRTWLIAVAALVSMIFLGVAAFQLRRIALQGQSELALRQTQDLLVESQHVAKLGYVLHDVSTGRLHWSESLFELRRVPRRESFSLEEAAQFIHPEDRPRYTAARKIAIEARKAFSIDVRVRRPDGTVCWEHRVVRPYFDASGDLIRVLMVVQDITKRKETELDLARSRDNMARAQHVAALGSFERDLITRKVEWSDEMYRILGVRRGQVVPGHGAILDLIHPDDRERYETVRELGLDGVATGTFEFRIIRPDGATRVIYRENGMIFDENGKPTRLFGSYQDVTEQRSAETRERDLERKLMHSQKLEALGTLAGGIAHDLNNTLTPIMALSKITARRLEPGSLLQNNLETIFAASEQARDLVQRVLAFSRQDKIDKKPTDLGEVVTEVLKLLRATVPSSIQIDARIDDAAPVLADRSQLHQVITNLVSNAAQAIGDDMGTIMVTIDTIAASTARETIRLSVTDTGRGMDPGTRDRIFEPFFTTKEVGQGTGLGLSIVASILADHGARVEVTSERGQGSRFDIYFPPLDAKAAAAA